MNFNHSHETGSTKVLKQTVTVEPAIRKKTQFRDGDRCCSDSSTEQRRKWSRETERHARQAWNVDVPSVPLQAQLLRVGALLRCSLSFKNKVDLNWCYHGDGNFLHVLQPFSPTEFYGCPAVSDPTCEKHSWSLMRISPMRATFRQVLCVIYSMESG